MRTISCRLLLAYLLLAGALPTSASPPVPSFNLVALGSDNQLVLFSSEAPSATKVVKVSGTDAPMIGMDVRPADHKLYGLSQAHTLFTVDPQSGAATRVSTLSTPFKGGTASGFDFNPQSDRLRLVAANGLNVRVAVEYGALAFDTSLTYAPTDVHSGRRPAVVAAGYTNSVADARSTILYVIDYQRDVLLQQEPPNDGVLTTIGKLGVDCGPDTGFDIATDARGIDHAFLVCKSELYRVDIRTGAARSLGKIGGALGEYLGLAVLSE